jgi:hypothetical protein
MLLGAVAIDAPQETPIEWVEAATQACSAALGEGRCVRGADTVDAAWRARVSNAAEVPTTLRVDLFDAERALEATRVLEFREVDLERQRWASAGVVVAALVSASEAQTSEPPTPPAVVPDRRPSPEGLPREPPRRPEVDWLWFDGKFEGAVLVASAEPAAGAGLGVGLRPAGPWVVQLNLHGAWATDPFNARWFSAEFGSGARLWDAPAWDVLAVARAEYAAVWEYRSLPPYERDEWGGARFGAGVQTQLAFPLGSSLAWVVAVAAGASQEMIVISEREQLGRMPVLSYGLGTGLRWVAFRDTPR